MSPGDFLEFSVATPDPKKYQWISNNIAAFGLIVCISMISVIVTMNFEANKVQEVYVRRYLSIETHG
jgi:hypothetical protein